MSLSYGFCLDELSSMYDSAHVSDAFHAVAGNGITPSGARMSVTVSGFTVTVGSGYALAAGRWLDNDEPLAMTVEASGDNEDRTDALVVRVDYVARKAVLEVLANVDPDKLSDELRSGKEYSVILYLIRVRRGSTSLTPDDVTDLRADPGLCGTVIPLSAVAGDVLYVYQFLTSGIDAEVSRLIDLSNTVIAKADVAIAELDAAIQKAGGGAEVGELMISRRPPSESGWLLCDGRAVPAEYPALSALLDGRLPNLSTANSRYATYIYAGKTEQSKARSSTKKSQGRCMLKCAATSHFMVGAP